MSRPLKDDADYFEHVKDFRDKIHIKALRRKYGPSGYAIIVMIQEVLCGSPGIQLEINVNTYELLSGDLDVEVELLEKVIDYSIQLEILQTENSFLRCRSLDKSLEKLFLSRSMTLKETRENIQHKNCSLEFPAQKPQENSHSIEKESKEQLSQGNTAKEKKEKKKKKSVEYKKTPELLRTLNALEPLLDQPCASSEVNSILNDYGFERVSQAITRMRNTGSNSMESLNSIIMDGLNNQMVSA
jgi:hypothetical protein